MQSCIYEGWVRHRRFQPVEHQFRNRLFLMYLDLSEVDHLFDRYWFWSSQRMALARFRREDYLGDTGTSLDDSVRQLVVDHGHVRPTGPIRLLTHMRYFGHLFNPVSFYYCFDERERLQYVVAQVTNTPWGERHSYVITPEQFAADTDRPINGKQFHVSPFMPMDLEYGWLVTAPSDRLSVRIANYQTTNEQQRPFFDAMLQLEKRPINSWNLSRVLWRYPLMTVQVVVNIYWQAFRLWMKGCPVYRHPGASDTPSVCPHKGSSAPSTPNKIEVRS